jgi:carboxymethylenebutenolidase
MAAAMTDVTFATDGASAAGFLASPAAPKAGIVVVHEWWGLNEGVRKMAERFADAGYAALAVDLYAGQVTDDAAVAMRLSNELASARALAVIAGGARHLAAAHGVGVAVTGFCLGGAMALAAACQLDEIAAAVPFYGTPRDELLTFARARPIQGHYALRDAFVSVERVRGLHDKALAAGATFELHFYDADHAFMREGDPAAYHEPSAKLAWSRTLAFLDRHLRPPPPPATSTPSARA